MTAVTGTPDTTFQDRPWKVFLVFLRPGLSSFGGSIAHLGFVGFAYFVASLIALLVVQFKQR